MESSAAWSTKPDTAHPIVRIDVGSLNGRVPAQAVVGTFPVIAAVRDMRDDTSLGLEEARKRLGLQNAAGGPTKLRIWVIEPKIPPLGLTI